MQRGKFITVEGIEGVGKSSNIGFLKDAIESRGIKVLTSREPGGTPTAEKIRDILFEHGDEPMSHIAETLLMFAARALHVENVIVPALDQGMWVICDRFTDSSRAYQGAGRGVSQQAINMLADLVHGDLQPDLTVLLDAPVETGKQRAGNRSAPDRIELERNDFFARARECFLELAAAEPQRFVVIDAGGDIDSVRRAVETEINRILDENSN